MTARRSDNPTAKKVPTPMPRVMKTRAASIAASRTTTSPTQARLPTRRSASNAEQKSATKDLAKNQPLVPEVAKPTAIPNVVPRSRPPMRNAAIVANMALTKNLAGKNNVAADDKPIEQITAAKKDAPTKKISNIEAKKPVQVI